MCLNDPDLACMTGNQATTEYRNFSDKASGTKWVMKSFGFRNKT